MLIIEYCKEGVPISDFQSKTFLESITFIYKQKPKQISYYSVSTSLPIELIQCEVAEGRMDPKKIAIRFQDKDYAINEYGALLKTPKGFCDINLDVAERILFAAMGERKNKKIIKAKRDFSKYTLQSYNNEGA